MFGNQKYTSLFGGAASKPTSLFGQASVSNAAAGATAGASTALPLFGTAQPQQQTTLGWAGTTGLVGAGGTNIAFNPPITTDTVQRGGQSTQVNAKHMCITAMKEYQEKCLEELRLEDYALNRRPGTGSTSTAGTASLFGTSSAVSMTNKPFPFNSTQATTSVAPMFGQAAKPTNTLFGGAPNVATGSNLFGTATNTSTQSVFNQTAQTQAGSIFGTTQPFGSTMATTAGGSLFGVGTHAVGSSTGATGFTFNQQQPSVGTGIFGVPGTTKPATPFGTVQPTTCTGLGFGTNTSSMFGLNKTANTAIGSTTPSLFGTPGVVNQQTTGTAFSFGAPKPGTTTIPAANLFNVVPSATKPVNLFGQQAGVSTGLPFGTTQQPSAFTFGNPGAGSAATNTLGTGYLFGPTNVKKTMGFSSPFGQTTPTAAVTTASGLFKFGQPAPVPAPTGGSLFGVPPAGCTIGAGTTFGPGNTTTSSPFSGASASPFSFNQKPAATGLGLGGFPVATGFGTSPATQGTGSTMFGPTGIGGSTIPIANPPGFNVGGLGMQPTFNTGGSSLTAYGTSEQLAQNVRIQQHVLELVRRMPYGDSPLFRYINLPAESATDGTTAKATTTYRSGTSLPHSQTGKVNKSASIAVAPVKVVANSLAERHRNAGISLGLSPAFSPTGGGAVAGGRNLRMMSSNPTVTQHLLQMSNRNKLFSGFYDDNDTNSPKKSSSYLTGLRRSTTLGGDVPRFADGSGGNSNFDDSSGSFFVRRNEWRRLRLSDSLRKSILDRSAASSREFSQLAEASLLADTTQNSSRLPGDGDTITGLQSNPALSTGQAVAGGDGNALVPSTALHAPSITNSLGVTSTAGNTSPLQTVDSIRRNTVVTTSSVASISSAVTKICRVKDVQPIGMTRAREALRQQPTTNDSVCFEDDLDTTWTANATIADLDGSKTSATSPQPSAEKQQQQQLSKSGVRLTRPGYYTLPSLEDLDGLVDADGRCIVENFVIGRRHYGHILFPGNTDVVGLNLDEIVHIRRREVVVYPDNDVEPPIGYGLNRVAEVCLEAIWPTDKATREPIKSSERLNLMRFEERLERATRRMDAKFIEYRPESGSWVFEVKHFSKYRLDESDDEGETDPDVALRVDPPPPALLLETQQKKAAECNDDPPVLQDKRPVLEGPEKTGKTTVNQSGTELPAITRSFRVDPGDRRQQEYTRNSVEESQLCADTRLMDATPLGRVPANSVALDLGMSPATVRQMRSAFFSPTSVASRPGRPGAFTTATVSDKRFGMSRYVDGDDAVDDYDEYDDLTDHSPMPANFGNHIQITDGKKRLYNEEYLSGAGFQRERSDWFDPASVDIGKDDVRFSPTPSKMLCRTASPVPSSTSEQKACPHPATPFRPLPKGNLHEGTSVYRGSAHLHNSSQIRLPSFVRIPGSCIPATDGTECPGGLYPYNLMMTKVWPCDLALVQKPLDAKLTHLFADLSLWQGHGLRTSWGLWRAAGSLHQLVLLTPSLLNASPSLTVSPFATNVNGYSAGSQPSGFTVSLNCWSPPVVEVTDEDLLNAALATSTQQFPDTTAFSAGTTLLLSSQHGRQKCAYWHPVKGLAPLESTANLLGCFQFMDHIATVTREIGKEERSARLTAIRRVVALCQCLWGRHPQELIRLRSTTPMVQEENGNGDDEEEDAATTTYGADAFSQEDDGSDCYSPRPARLSKGVHVLSRKQALSEWIRVQSSAWLKSRLLKFGLWESVDDVNPSSLGAKPAVSFQSQRTVPFTNLKDANESDVMEGVFTCLVAGEPSLGCRLALGANLHRLATLIAQSSAGDPLVRRALQRQMTVWRQTKFDQHIPLPVLRIYSLLAGQDQFMHPKKPTTVSILDGLDWVRVLGVYLWYLTDYSTDLSEVLRTYSEHWHSTGTLSIARPLPPTVADLLDPPHHRACANDFPNSSDHQQKEKDGKSSRFRDWPRDMAYHLLQLYCSRSHSLERTLEPTGLLVYRGAAKDSQSVSCAVDPTGLLDWSGSWHLWRILSGLGYCHLSSDAASHLCTEFASQLEAAGLWEWAIFVLLHIHDPLTRETSVKTLVARHASLVRSEQWFDAAVHTQKQGLQPTPPLTKAEKFVVQRLGVPIRWLHEAKAILARHRLRGLALRRSDCVLDSVSSQPDSSTRRHRHRLQTCLFAMLEASSWLAAGHYSAAHAVCVDCLLPDVMLHTDLLSQVVATRPSADLVATQLGNRLSMLLEPFTLLPPSHRPPNVSTGVGVYMKYRNILSLADDLSHLYQSRAVPSLPNPAEYHPVSKGGIGDGGEQFPSSANGDDQPVVTAAGEETSDSEWHGRLAHTINSLHDELVGLTQQLQCMPADSLTANVMRTEMAVMCAHLISAFLTVDDSSNSECGEHQRQLISLTNMGLPVDYRLRELRRLSELKLTVPAVG